VQAAIFALFPTLAKKHGWRTPDEVCIPIFNDGTHRTIEDVRRVVKEARV